MPRARTFVLVALGAIVVLVGLVGLSAFVELPGERRFKERVLGVRYGPPPCPPLGRVEMGRWRAEAELPSLRDEPRGVRIGDGVFVAGGIGRFKPQTSVATFERYDLAARRWEPLPPMPEPANHIGMVAWRGDVYVAGGFTERGDKVVATGALWRYRVAERRWERLASMPTARGALGAAVAGDRLYAVGGQDPASERDFAAVEAYDLETGGWSARAPLPGEPRDHLAAAALDGAVYAAGGRRPDGSVLADFARYDPVRDAWERLPALPAATSGIGLEAVGGRLVTAGGELPLEERTLDGVWSFSDGRWSRAAKLPVPKHGYAMASRGDRLYVLGGSRCAGFNPVRSAESIRLPAA